MNFVEMKNFYHEQLEDVMDFWIKSDLIDTKYGGCITSVDRFGKSYNNEKSVWFQGRCLFTFSALCNKYGKRQEWLNGAESAKKFSDIKGRPCEPLEWDMKLWWVHCEALIGSLYAYSITKDEKYLKLFERLHHYTFSHFPDKEYGEWYGYLHRDGTVSHTQKGSMWKGPYHIPRCLMTIESILDSIINDTAPISIL